MTNCLFYIIKNICQTERGERMVCVHNLGEIGVYKGKNNK